MKKIIITGGLLLAFAGALFAQENGGRIEWEGSYVALCLVDSVSATNQTQFWRIVPLNHTNRIDNLPGKTFQDVNYKFTGNYTVTGTVIRCHEQNVSGCPTANTGSFDEYTSGTHTYAANTLYSIAIANIAGVTQIKLGSGSFVTMSIGEVVTYTAPDPCDRFQSQVVVTTTGVVHIGKIE